MIFSAWLTAAIHLAALCTPELPGLAPGMAFVELARVALLAMGLSLGICLCVAGVLHEKERG